MLRIIYNEFTKWGLSRMKNRDRYILKCNEFDMLTDMNKKILSASNEEYCIMHCLNHKKDIDDKCWFVNSCETCIRKWLNEES